MGFAEVLIALIVVGLPVILGFLLVIRTFKHHEKKMELQAQIAAAKTGGRPQDDRLEQRVRVLERIVTDKGIDVADEIERLRAPSRRTREIEES